MGILKEQEALDYLEQIVIGYTNMRNQGIQNRDITIHNILKNGNDIIVDDFGFMNLIEFQINKSRQYCISYPPELFVQQKQGQFIQYPSQKDSQVWSIGIIFYYMLFGKYPFVHQDPVQLLKMITTQKLDIPLNVNSISINCQNLLLQLLYPDPKYRIKWDQIFGHECFKKRMLQKQALNQKMQAMQQNQEQSWKQSCYQMFNHKFKAVKNQFNLGGQQQQQNYQINKQQHDIQKQKYNLNNIQDAVMPSQRVSNVQKQPEFQNFMKSYRNFNNQLKKETQNYYQGQTDFEYLNSQNKEEQWNLFGDMQQSTNYGQVGSTNQNTKQSQYPNLSSESSNQSQNQQFANNNNNFQINASLNCQIQQSQGQQQQQSQFQSQFPNQQQQQSKYPSMFSGDNSNQSQNNIQQSCYPSSISSSSYKSNNNNQNQGDNSIFASQFKPKNSQIQQNNQTAQEDLILFSDFNPKQNFINNQDSNQQNQQFLQQQQNQQEDLIRFSSFQPVKNPEQQNPKQDDLMLSFSKQVSTQEQQQNSKLQSSYQENSIMSSFMSLKYDQLGQNLKDISNQKNVQPSFEKDMDLLKMLKKKIDIFGETLVEIDELFNAEHNEWIVMCYILAKSNYIQRCQLEAVLMSNHNILGVSNWQELKKTREFQDFSEQIDKENCEMYQNLIRILSATEKMLRLKSPKTVQDTLNNLNKHIHEDFKNSFFVYFYSYQKYIKSQLQGLKVLYDQQQKDKDASDNYRDFLKHYAKVLDTFIISEMNSGEITNGYFSYEEYQKIQLSGDIQKIEDYIKIKQELLEIYRNVYQAKGFNIQQ